MAGEFFFYIYPGGGTGRRAGLKILSAEMRVRVRFPSGVLNFLTFIEWDALKHPILLKIRHDRSSFTLSATNLKMSCTEH
jgi:hypothetical protein